MGTIWQSNTLDGLDGEAEGQKEIENRWSKVCIVNDSRVFFTPATLPRFKNFQNKALKGRYS